MSGESTRIAAPPLRSPRTGAPDEQRARQEIIDDVRQMFGPLLGLLSRGRLIVGLSLAAGTEKRFSHGLGRKPAGWFCSRLRGAAGGASTNAVWEGATASDETSLYLSCADAVSFDLVVF